MEEAPVVRHRPQIEFKMVSKTGQQVKDEGLKYLQWSLSSTGITDYVSFVRGKSNVVQVFDTVTENALFTKKYDMTSPIKGLGSIGQTVFDLKNVIVMENGKMIIDQAQNEAPKKKKSAEATSASSSLTSWQLSMVPGSKVTCMSQNPFQRSKFVVGFKDTLL